MNFLRSNMSCKYNAWNVIFQAASRILLAVFGIGCVKYCISLTSAAYLNLLEELKADRFCLHGKF